MRIWSKPHYRTGTFREDAATNLRNVAIPGTGIPLSVLCYFKPAAYAYWFFGYPATCATAGLNIARIKGGGLGLAAKEYSKQLLTPKDWFSFWRLNCRLASWHAAVTGDKGYDMENKWTFLVEGEAAGVAVSPWLKTDGLCIKHKNEEGGMGIFFYKNALAGGDWIIQERMSNSAFVRSLLPQNAPLSTFRIITASRGGIEGQSGVQSLSCVFRAGRAGADTDHSSILFDVNMETGEILKGTTNMHWYQLGLAKAARTPWVCLSHDITAHPDTAGEVTGHFVPDIAGMRAMVEDAHAKMLPGVPLAGWDIALTEEHGACLLEANLSCNFFRGTFELDEYLQFIEDYLLYCEKKEEGN